MYSNVSPWEVIALTRNKVEICGVDTSKLPVLTNAEMRELFTITSTAVVFRAPSTEREYRPSTSRAWAGRSSALTAALSALRSERANFSWSGELSTPR